MNMTIVTVDNNHLENISDIESEFNQSTYLANNESWDESTISCTNPTKNDNNSTYLGNPSIYQDSVF